MRTRCGWQATVGELDPVLGHRDVAQDADAQVRDGRYRAVSTHGTAPVTASSAARWRDGSPHSPHTRPRERDEEL